MRIALYGLPTAGKTFILDAVKNLEVLSGSTLLKELAPDFHDLTVDEKDEVRKHLALELKNKDEFIMDGHYSFGDEIVFTNEDGQLYDVFLYLYVDPDILKERMAGSARNSKYLKYDLAEWQDFEMESLREYCHKNNKDFYVIDNPGKGYFSDINIVLEFIDSIICGFSCVKAAENIVGMIIATPDISLVDGDKTFIIEDSSASLGYKTHLFDGNFYTGFQSWRHHRELTEYLRGIDYSAQLIDEMGLTLNDRITNLITSNTVILTTGLSCAWKQIGKKYDIPVFYGNMMCSDTKYFVTKFLQDKDIRVTAVGDSMNDYYMLKQADAGYLVLKKDGSVSSSLKRKDLEGLMFV